MISLNFILITKRIGVKINIFIFNMLLLINFCVSMLLVLLCCK